MNKIQKEEVFPNRQEKLGVSVLTACVKLDKNHPCYGCVWYVRDTDVLFCPFGQCIRKKKDFMILEKRNVN